MSAVEVHEAHANNINFSSTKTWTPAHGNTIIVHAAIQGGNSLSVADDVDGAYTAISYTSTFNGDICYLFYKRNVTGGISTNVTTTLTGTGFYWVQYLEYSGLSNSATILSDNVTDTDNDTTHTSAATGLSGTGVFLGTGIDNVVATNTPAGGWTMNVDGSVVILQRIVQTATLELGPWTSSLNARTAGLLVLFPEAAGGTFNLVRP